LVRTVPVEPDPPVTLLPLAVVLTAPEELEPPGAAAFAPLVRATGAATPVAT